ncbi:Bug family tripartite tricarboxylate transporter substrate binding protein [Achromobacter aloeverae]|uniref:ABC transporter substrate-binding protein n=1 Tax=Achromobacter aloeverae TaxID=1750518 RepID=A0A4Q1HGZ2_9BURK|nr:tripartite tricarboxylate transporter substrate binding protein [Achromobacter aloeverae]RXN85904.1 hypothetical protein C7R54_19235 [Achromobacter aloeverae]
MHLRPIRVALAALVLWSGAAGSAWADYPDKPIRLVVPYAAGGGVDNISRVVATELGARLKQSVVIENRGGANGNIGTEYVARAAPDGYTVLMGATYLGFNRATMANLPYDAAKDLQPVARTGRAPFVLVVPATTAIHDVAGLVAWMKANPDKASYGAVGAGSPTNLLFPQNTGTKPVQVLYKGGSAALPDLLAGRLTFMIPTASEVVPLVESGKLRALAVTGSERFHRLPDVPTMGEAGVPNLELIGWWGMFAPAGTPQPAVKKLSDAIQAVMAQPNVIEALNKLGVEAAPMPTQAFTAFYNQELKTYADVARQFGLKVE